MKNESSQKDAQKEEKEKMVENYYKKIMRILEYYVLLCFILITFIPLLDFSWVQPFVKFVYLTGFPLLILIFAISLFKEPILAFILKFVEK
ncbi:MAG: hypothetical protein ACK2TU_13030 [Anaerolineales bacterium]|jgi:hypothetical protein